MTSNKKLLPKAIFPLSSPKLENLEEEGKVDSVVVTGPPAIFDVVINTINETMIGSIAYTILLSFIILTAVFWYTDGQPLLGIISMLPVLLVLVWILGTMVTIGYTLNVMTILIGALTVGLGVTYAIHISHRFIEEIEHRMTKNNHLIVPLEIDIGYGNNWDEAH